MLSSEMSLKSRYFKRKDTAYREVKVVENFPSSNPNQTKDNTVEGSVISNKRRKLDQSKSSTVCIESKLSAFSVKDTQQNQETDLLSTHTNNVNFENNLSNPDTYQQPELMSDQKVKRKLTPLEEQVIDLKSRHPDLLLMVACGYRYRFFGDNDANAASRVLDIR